MGGAHLHLILNHFLIAGTVVAAATFGVGWWRRNLPFQRFALGLLLAFAGAAIPSVFAAGLLALALSTTGLFVRTGYLGGQIRHAEIRAGAPGQQAAAVEGRPASLRNDD